MTPGSQKAETIGGGHFFRTTITKRYHFEAGHYLPLVPDGHKCKRQHGHNYEVEVTVVGPKQVNGFLIDFWDLDPVVQKVLDEVDHRNLNDIPGLENPTAENIAAWFMHMLNAYLHDSNYRVSMLRLYETKDCWATVTRVAARDQE